MNDVKYIIEIATSDFLTTKSAVEGRADRIELCANLCLHIECTGDNTIQPVSKKADSYE